MRWPGGKDFAFTVFDDADSQTLENGKPVYDHLAALGFRTTKSVWPVRGPGIPSDPGETLDEPHYLRWVRELDEQGFEIGYHMATSHTSTRRETIAALDRFAERLGADPTTMANHYNCDENLYFGPHRVTGPRRLLYDLLTRYKNHGRFRGHVPEQELYWGDVCRARIKYVRNFVFGDVDTLAACPVMPYHDPDRPCVNYWFASSEGAVVDTFNERLSEENQDRLEASGGACIMYAHFGLGFSRRRTLEPRFASLMRRLSRKNGWFVPVRTLLDHLLAQRPRAAVISRAERARLEWRWLAHKVQHKSA